MWLSEVIPLASASLIVSLVVIIFDIDSSTNVLALFFSTLILLFFSGFLLAEAMKEAKLDEYIALLIISRVPADGRVLMLTLMGITAFFSMFMSNTAAAAVLIPLAVTLLNDLDEDNIGYKKSVVLGIAYAASLGGVGSLIGTPPTMIAYSTHLYRTKEIFNIGVVLDILGWLLVSVLSISLFVLIPT